jgi:hypothetical protein
VDHVGELLPDVQLVLALHGSNLLRCCMLLTVQ